MELERKENFACKVELPFVGLLSKDIILYDIAGARVALVYPLRDIFKYGEHADIDSFASERLPSNRYVKISH
jgi:hypothetical protein